MTNEKTKPRLYANSRPRAKETRVRVVGHFQSRSHFRGGGGFDVSVNQSDTGAPGDLAESFRVGLNIARIPRSTIITVAIQSNRLGLSSALNPNAQENVAYHRTSSQRHDFIKMDF